MGRRTEKEVRVKAFADGLRSAGETINTFMNGGSFTLEEALRFLNGIADTMSPAGQEVEQSSEPD